MGLFDRIPGRGSQKQAQNETPQEKENRAESYSGMRVEVAALDGRVLFGAKMESHRGGKALLYQYYESQAPEGTEPIRVRIRGYNLSLRKAVHMEGTISPLPEHIWQAEELVMVQAGNERAFFRLDTNLDAVVTTFGGVGSEEYHCRLLNISVGGVCISSDRRHHEGDKLLLKMKLMEDRDTSVIFCQVMRVTDRGNGRFEYGCRFLELNNADEEHILQNIFAAQRKKRGM